MYDDFYAANSYYAAVGGVDIEELQQQELRFLVAIGWKVFLRKENLKLALVQLRSFSYNEATHAFEFKKGYIKPKLSRQKSMAVQTPDPSKVPAKLKKIDKKSKSNSAVSKGPSNFHKRTLKRDPTDTEACEACDYNCCCEMLRLAVKKLGGHRDNYMIQG